MKLLHTDFPSGLERKIKGDRKGMMLEFIDQENKSCHSSIRIPDHQIIIKMQDDCV